MNKIYRILSFLISLLVLFVILFIAYRIGKKSGIKKSLFRISYITICVLIAFLVAPYFTNFILNFNLYPHGLSIQYHGLTFYRLIDFIEEVIVHSDVLNDIYYLIPNLKNLLMDFPQIIFIPIVYLLAFLLLLLFFYPLYMYIGYRRKRRVLYNISYKKSGNIWAGVITSIQTIFLISIILTPVNGLVRIYSDAKEDVISNDTNICKENSYLNKYSYACNVVEVYDNTVFNKIGDNYVNRYVYNSLTKIQYNNHNSSLNKEILAISRAGMVLNKTGLLEIINTDFSDFKDYEDFENLTNIDFKSLNSNEIDIIVNAFKESLYSKEVLDDLYVFASNYLSYLLKTSLDLNVMVDLSYEELIEELRIVLTTINYVLNDQEMLNSVNQVYKRVENFLKLPSKDRFNSGISIRFGFSLGYVVNVDSLVNTYNLLRESKIYKTMIPKIIDGTLKRFGIHVNLNADPDEMDQVVLKALDIIRIVQNHKYVDDVLWFISELTDNEIAKFSELLNYLNNSKTMSTLLYDLANFGIEKSKISLDIPTELIFDIKDWEREIKLAQQVVQIVREAIYYNNINYGKALYVIENFKDTVIFDYALKFAIKLLPEAFKTWIAGKGFKHLVGEYV